jgi:TPR repeat protein
MPRVVSVLGSITMETTAFRQSRGSRALDSEQVASHPSTASYIRARAERTDPSSHDPIPLFLSDPLSEPNPREFVPLAARNRTRIVPRILAAILAAAAIAVPVALFQSDINRLLSVNGKSWMGAAADEAAASANPPAARQSPVKDAARVTNTMLASADARDMPAPAAPSREAIATAYQTALQAQAPVPVPAPVAEQPASPPPAKTLDADTLAGLMARARSLMTVGDIAAARLLLERAANAQDATAAFVLAQTYDPAVLGTRDTRSITADAVAARDWYRKAAQLGSAEARQRLSQLQN